MSTVHRFLKMLTLLPGNGEKISVKKLEERLSDEGLEVTVRMIQRDLKALEKIRMFPLEKKKAGGSNTNLWGWRKGEVIDLQAMTPFLATTFLLAQRHLQHVMPPGLLQQMQPYFALAAKRLSGAGDPSLRRWLEKVAILPRSLNLIPAEVDADIHAEIMRGLLEEKRLEVSYKKPRAEELGRYVLNPLALVVRGETSYLVASVVEPHEGIRHFALHRFKAAEVLPKRASTPPGFNLQRHLHDERAFEIPVQDAPIQLVALFKKERIGHLYETRLSEDQTIELQDDGREKLSATVKDSMELRWWLLGFADGVEVLEPVALRDEFVEIAKGFRAVYLKKKA
jgi:predicted DNA-binding transcriptional regulator YafY